MKSHREGALPVVSLTVPLVLFPFLWVHDRLSEKKSYVSPDANTEFSLPQTQSTTFITPNFSYSPSVYNSPHRHIHQRPAIGAMHRLVRGALLQNRGWKSGGTLLRMRDSGSLTTATNPCLHSYAVSGVTSSRMDYSVERCSLRRYGRRELYQI